MPETEQKTDPDWQCPNECPYQADDKLTYKIMMRYHRGLRQYRVFVLSTVAIALIYIWNYTDGKRPSITDVVLGFGWLIVSLDRPTLLTDTASKLLDKFGGNDHE